MIREFDISLARNGKTTFEPNVFQKILLVTDGTLTKILEAYLQEKLNVVKLSEKLITLPQVIEPLDIPAGQELIQRRILLQGSRSQTNWLYAESFIVPDRLHKSFKEQLLTSQKPIGKLWLEYKLETFKEVIDSSHEPAGSIADYFQLSPTVGLLSRTYRVFSNRLPVMMITEKFPDCYFLNV